jgi:hypothetical protein
MILLVMPYLIFCLSNLGATQSNDANYRVNLSRNIKTNRICDPFPATT